MIMHPNGKFPSFRVIEAGRVFSMKLLPLLTLIAATLVAVPGICAPDENAAAVPHESIEWCDAWMPHTNDRDLPRVLLIGDSITRAYFPAVDKLLVGRAFCARICTSRCVGDPALLEEIAAFAHREKFDVVHFNNGMHGWANSEAFYGTAFPDFVAAIQKAAPGAKLIWTSTTAVRPDAKNTTNDRIRERNRLALEFVSKLGIAVDDQFALTVDHPEWHSDSVHFAGKGVTAEAEQVAREIEKALRAK